MNQNTMALQQKRKKKMRIQLILLAMYAIIIGCSFLWNFEIGKSIGREGWRFFKSLLTLFPAAFILIGLFEVWVDRSIIEKHLGHESGMISHLWAFLLASTIMAPLIIALPVAHSLSKKGARFSIVISFISASTICRIPMTIFEATYLGLPFSIIRLTVSIPLVILFSEFLGKVFDDTDYKPL